MNTLCNKQQMANAYCNEVTLSLIASRQNVHETPSRGKRTSAAHKLYLNTRVTIIFFQNIQMPLCLISLFRH